MTEEIAATPGWVEERLDRIFANMPEATRAAQGDYAACLARRKSPGAPSDLLGAAFDGCRGALRRALLGAGLASAEIDRLETELEVLEAKIDAGS